MDSGCFAFLSENSVVFAVKDGALALLLTGDFEPAVRFTFDFIDKEEFPAVCAVIFIEGQKSFSVRHEYFFSLDSGTDLESLKFLSSSQETEMWFFSSGDEPVAGFAVQFDENERLRIMSALRRSGRFSLT